MADKIDPIVFIRRQWNDWQIAQIRLSELSDFRWDNISGGYQSKAPRLFIHGYCSCANVKGEIGHSCVHGSAPHRIKVCITKIGNDPEVFERILALAGPRPNN